MYGAILGDMIGAPYEFDRGKKTKKFPLFCTESHYTDDSVMTIAVAEALLDKRFRDDETVKAGLVDSMRKWGRKYPDAGYGGRFRRWLRAEEPKPYGSYGNGSAMRVSSAGWLFDTLEQTRHMARLTAEVTHNHPEGIKGAEAAAGAVYLARTGHSKEEIKDYIAKEFGYDLSRTCDQIRPGYHHVESCQGTVPEAITAFLEGTDFEDVIRTAVSLGGDCDTLTCIAGSIAEAFYGVPEQMKDECRSRLPKDMLDVLGLFDIAREHGHDRFPDSFLTGNSMIEEAIARYYEQSDQDNLLAVVNAILYRMHAIGHFLIPAVIREDGASFDLHRIRANDGKLWLAVFTSTEEYEKGQKASVLSYFIDAFLEICADMQEEGIVINPWGQSFLLTKDLIKLLLQVSKEGSAP
ncbi:MAG: ADP-ribosylglycohydrolase family protein [Oscillospiraceae bacterium]|nr:ADP-ribosylglycohydrolase family protein [Oscillospiraceae bacterium]